MAERKKTDVNITAVSSTRHLQSKGDNMYGCIKVLLEKLTCEIERKMIMWQAEMEEGLAGGQN